MLNKLSGASLSFLSSFFFALMGAFIKWVDLPASQIVFFRGFFTLSILVFFMLRNNCSFRGKNIPLLLLRGFLGALSLLANSYSIGHISFLEAGALQELSPIFVIIFASIFLHERLSRTFIYLTAVSFLGYLMIVSPLTGSVISTKVALITLFGAMASGLAYICIRKLSETEPPYLIIFYFFIMSMIVSLPGTIQNFQMPSILDIGKILIVAVSSILGQITMTLAYGKEKAGIVAVISYSLIFFHLLLGIIFWKEIPVFFAVVGSSLILISGIAINYMRSKQKISAQLSTSPSTEQE